jgi:hypothetical protein
MRQYVFSPRLSRYNGAGGAVEVCGDLLGRLDQGKSPALLGADVPDKLLPRLCATCRACLLLSRCPVEASPVKDELADMLLGGGRG